MDESLEVEVGRYLVWAAGLELRAMAAEQAALLGVELEPAMTPLRLALADAGDLIRTTQDAERELKGAIKEFERLDREIQLVGNGPTATLVEQLKTAFARLYNATARCLGLHWRLTGSLQLVASQIGVARSAKSARSH